jgi:hypothetical protein
MPQHWDSVGAVDAMNASLAGTISDVKQLTPFSFDWPQGIEEFESGWEFTRTYTGKSIGSDMGLEVGRSTASCSYPRLRGASAHT